MVVGEAGDADRGTAAEAGLLTKDVAEQARIVRIQRLA
jgi:hypothetical protein